MGKTYKRLGSWGDRHIHGHRRSEQHREDIRPGARIPNPWLGFPRCDICYIPYKVARALHLKGWDDEKIRRHLRWKFDLRNDEVNNIGIGYWWNCKCDRCRAR